MLYMVLKRMVAKGLNEELRDKIDTLYALGRLSDAQYRALTGEENK